MKSITKNIDLSIPAHLAFQKFVIDFNYWWPKEYTWSQDKLEEIRIDGKVNGLCTEIGPHGFRSDWGRVTEFRQGQYLEMKWQISPNREPVPNPDHASDLKISFRKNGDGTVVEFEHANFENHGDGAEKYRQMMDSEMGWDYILKAYQTYCEGK